MFVGADPTPFQPHSCVNELKNSFRLIVRYVVTANMVAFVGTSQDRTLTLGIVSALLSCLGTITKWVLQT